MEGQKGDFMEKKNSLKTKRFLAYAGVVALILAAIIISLLFYRQKIETTNTVFKNLTEDWQTYKNDYIGFSFKYPKDWSVHVIKPESFRSDPFIFINKNGEHEINNRVTEQRSINSTNPNDAIQISIPFDKKNYLIFSTSTNSDQKEIFYNIPVTLVIGK
jgi:hypothetical protein